MEKILNWGILSTARINRALIKPLNTSKRIRRRGEVEEKILVKGQKLYLGEVHDMCDAIESNRPARIPLADSRENIEVILALIESVNDHRLVFMTKTV